MHRRIHRSVPPLFCAAVAFASGCLMLDRYVSRSPEDALAAEAIGQWATPGAPFLDGVSGRATVASVSPTGARAWEVAVVPPSGGGPMVWSLEFPEIDIHPVFPGPAFAPWLERRARELGMHDVIPEEVATEVRSGQILAVAEMEVRYGPADRTGRRTEERIAYLAPRTSGNDAEWRIQPVTRSAAALSEALETVTEDLIHRDDRVRRCMGSASPAGVPRSTQLDCVRKVLERQFGGS